MKNKKILIVLILAFVLLMAGASLLYDRLGQDATPEQLATHPPAVTGPTDAAQQSTESPEVLAPDFTVYDIDGNEVNLYDYLGKPIVLNFWASWCGPCKMEMPDFNAKYQEIGDDVHFLMINMTDGSRETVETASAFIEEQGYTFPVYFDSGMDAAYTYGAYSLPTTYFIDAEGKAIAQATGAIDADTLQRGIDMIYSAG